MELGEKEYAQETFTCHPDFLKHNAQRYLGFSEKTRYPLVSALRVQKYKERGYDISKGQMLKLLLAVNAKNIDSWEVLLDELGSMYGLKPDEIFDTSKEFSLESAMEQLDKVFTIPNKMYKNVSIDWDSIYKEFIGKWDSDTVEWMESKGTTYSYGNTFTKWKAKQKTKDVSSFFGVEEKQFAFPPVPCYPSPSPAIFG